MLVRAPYFFFLILAVCCWFKYNAAVPLTLRSPNQSTALRKLSVPRMHYALKEKKTDSENELDSISLDSRSTKENMDVASEGDEDNEKNIENDETDETDENINMIRNENQNININANFGYGKRNRNKRLKLNEKSPKRIEDILTARDRRTLEEIAKEEIATNCVTNNKKNQRYSSSFVGNSTNHELTLEKEFHDVVGNNSKVKKSSSVHEGEDITLCWIEKTTIKEDKTIQPPKRLVIREYTISFENSATIPEKYLECKRYEGELVANDPDIGKTALFEIIDEDTMVSRIVNFTSISHANNITTWEHKKVKCGVGPVVSKDIVELNDGSKNPKKRVEIKISPKMHQLTASTTEEEPCTETSEETGKGSTITESTERVTGLSCENGVCEATISPSSILRKSNEISAESKGTSSESENAEEHSLPTVSKILVNEQIFRKSTTFPELSTTIQKSHEKVDCEENSSDPACVFLPLSPQVTTEASEMSTLTRDKVTLEEEVSLSSVEGRMTTQRFFTLDEKRRYASEETTPMDISEEFSEEHVSQSTDESVDDGSGSLKITGEKGVSDSTEMTSEEKGKIDHAPSSSTDIVISREVDTEPEVTTAISSELNEFTRTDKLGKILDKLSEPTMSSEAVTEAAEYPISEEVSFEKSTESEESATSAIKETTVGLKVSSEEEEFTLNTTETRAQIRSTTLSPAKSTEVDRLCKNSEECAYATSSEFCDEFGNCGETTTKCDSEICSGEDEDKSKFDTSSSPMRTEISPTSLELFEDSRKSTMMETQYTTVANAATPMLTSRESESNLTAINIIPITLDTRRSTTISTPQHKLSLKVKVLLEHINENEEKQNLVEVEKYLSLDEIPGHYDDPNLLEQIKSLNESVNREALNALLNCTSLGNLTRHSSSVSNKKLIDDIDDSDEEVEYTTNSDVENLISEQFASEIDSTNDYSDYEESEVSPRRRKARSLDNEIAKLNRFVRETLYNSTDSTINSFNTSESPTELMKDNTTLFTTTNYTEEEATENKSNVTESKGVSEIFSTTTSIVDLLNATEFRDVNLTTEYIQLTTIGNNSEEETSSAVYINDTENERNESAIPSTTEINNETKLEVARKTLPGIQEDVVSGLQHMVSQLAQSNLTSTLSNIKESVKTNLLSILADPKDKRAHSRRKRAAAEEVGHWSNERIKEAPMGGNLRSLTEFTLYKVLP